MKRLYLLFGGKLFLVAFLVLFVIEIFTRFYALETKSVFVWDQIDNAWAAKNIIVDHKFPLVGMQAKSSTDFYIGPYYYYYVALFYLFTGLDPIASGIIAGVTSIISFFVVFFTLKDILNQKIAIIALFFYTVSSHIIITDRVQWPVNFILPVSLLIFYSLYKIINKQEKYLLLLSFALGLSLHVHFTSIFYFILVLLSVPFFPRTKQFLKYALSSLVIFAFFVSPIVINAFISESTTKVSSYLSTYYHGLHLRRVLQIAKDGFIEFEAILGLSQLKYAGFFLFPLFVFTYLIGRGPVDAPPPSDNPRSLTLPAGARRGSPSAHHPFNKFILIYLCTAWILVPWFAFATYRGELTNYYFFLTRPVVLIVLSYLIYRLLMLKKILFVPLVVFIMAFYFYYNAKIFFARREIGLAFYRPIVLQMVKDKQKPNFSPGDPKPYLYYYYMYSKNEK